MEIEIDEKSGFCFGVVNAIKIAEEQLEKYGSLYCLGDIVHNNREIERLKTKGLIVISHEDMKNLYNTRILIRAHGEPPASYKLALENNLEIIDASCPVVLKLQGRIRKGFSEMIARDGQIVIYGKEGHAEVNGLIGQTNGHAIVVDGGKSSLEKIDYTRPVTLFSQTTQSIEGFHSLVIEIKKRIDQQKCEGDQFQPFDTICRQVANRGPHLAEFANKHDAIVFVSGKKSSNGLYLYNICKSKNEKSYMISGVDEISQNWFAGVNSIGICGATSTPRWLMEEVKNFLLTT